MTENPSPVPSSLNIGAPQVATKPVASFHASTTYGPTAPTEVSDCPWAETPAGLTSSAGLAASTLAGAPGPAKIWAGRAVDPGCSWAPKQYMFAPDEAWICFPSRWQKGLSFRATVAARAPAPVPCPAACGKAGAALAARAAGATPPSPKAITEPAVKVSSNLL